MKKIIELAMLQKKETKNTVVYEPTTDEGIEIIPSLYIRKSALRAHNFPTAIVVTVEKPSDE